MVRFDVTMLIGCGLGALLAGVACGACGARGAVVEDDPFVEDAGIKRDAGGAAAETAPPLSGPTLEEQGETFVSERGCASCHQSSDPGDGVLSGQTAPRTGTHAYGANLTPDVQTGIGGWSDEMILRAIREGTDPGGETLCLTMPRFADLEEAQGAAVVAYLRALTPVARAIPDSQCLERGNELDAGPAEVDQDASDDANDPDSGCGPFIPPYLTAACHACQDRPCQPNGCFGGYFCDKVSTTCHPPPDACAP